MTLSSPIAIVGTGRVAQALGRLLRDLGAPVRAIAGRDPERARPATQFVGDVEAARIEDLPKLAQRIIIAVPDAVIARVAGQLAKAGMREGIVLHTSGCAGLDALKPLTQTRAFDGGVSTGVLHPFQTIPTPEQGVRDLPGSYFGIGGDDRAVAWAKEIAGLLKGTALSIRPEHWAPYHAAAVMASNFQVTLADAALEALETAGVDPVDGLKALGPIMRAALENILQLGPQGALTGPVARGDAETVRANLSALKAAGPATRELYRAAALRTLGIAHRRGLPHATIHEMMKVIENPL